MEEEKRYSLNPCFLSSYRIYRNPVFADPLRKCRCEPIRKSGGFNIREVDNRAVAKVENNGSIKVSSSGSLTMQNLSGLSGSDESVADLPAGTRTISLLCVDDNEGVLETLKIFFAHEPDFVLETCDTAAAALSLLGRRHFDVIVADYAMPDMDGIALLKEVRSRGYRTLFIIFTARHLARVPIEALNNGGDYYLQKGTDIGSELPRMADYIRKTLVVRDKDHLPSADELQYRSLLENPLDLICSFHPDGRYTLANEIFAQFIGRDGEDIFEDSFFSIVPEDERETVRSYLRNLSRDNPGIYIEHPIITAGGSPRIVEWAYWAIFDSSGTVTEYHARGRDAAAIVRLVPPPAEDSAALPGQPPSPSEETHHNDVSGQVHPAGTAGSSRWQEIADSIDPLEYPVFAIDKNGVVIAWNSVIAALTGIPAQKMIGRGDYAYAVPFYGTARPMLIDRIFELPDSPGTGTVPALIHDGSTYIGDIEQVTIRGRAMILKGMGTRVLDAGGNLIAAIQSIMVHDQADAEIDDADTALEEYLGGVSSTAIKVTGSGLAGALGSTTGGYGVYVTSSRLFVIHHPDLDASSGNGIQFGTFIISELFGTSPDTRPLAVADLERLRVFEVQRGNLTSIALRKPVLLAGSVTFLTGSGESFRIYIDHKNTFFHIERLLRFFYPEIRYTD